MSAAPVREAPGGVDVHLEGVVHIYPMPEGDVVALRGVDLDVEGGELVALLGPSGAGKSTVLGLTAGLVRPSAGRVRIGPHDVGRMSSRELVRLRATEVGIVLQDPARNLLPYATAAENVWFAQRGSRRRERAWRPRDLLDRLGLGEVAAQPVSTLSGGEQQRVALAVGAAGTPRLLLVDEPTSQLDAGSRDRVMGVLETLNQDLGLTVVVVTHDPAVAGAVARTVTIRDGRVGAEGRRGEEYAVVGRDGTLQLPPDVLETLPPCTLLRLRRHATGVDLSAPDLDR